MCRCRLPPAIHSHAGGMATCPSPSPGNPGEECMALIDIPPGHVGAVVTYLEMIERPPLPSPPPSAPLALERWEDPSPARYRRLFERIGGPWLWYSRLTVDDETLAA